MLICPYLHTGAVVALGKFDALHLGHRSLAVAASAIGSPVLLSFSGMAEVLGWPANLPLVAPVDRPRVLASWSDACGGKPVSARVIPFALIRRMPPEEFVRLLAQDLKAAGVVAGANYRFGMCRLRVNTHQTCPGASSCMLVVCKIADGVANARILASACLCVPSIDRGCMEGAAGAVICVCQWSPRPQDSVQALEPMHGPVEEYV